jgi:hypothetical protein
VSQGQGLSVTVPSTHGVDRSRANIRLLSSTAFVAFVSFILKVRHVGGHVKICNIDELVRFGADVIRLGDYAEFATNRNSSIDGLLTHYDQGISPSQLLLCPVRNSIACFFLEKSLTRTEEMLRNRVRASGPRSSATPCD